MSMYRCDKHGGHGFINDCEICNEEKIQASLHKRIAELEQELADKDSQLAEYHKYITERDKENASLKEQVRVRGERMEILYGYAVRGIPVEGTKEIDNV